MSDAKAKKKSEKRRAAKADGADVSPGWADAGDGYRVALEGGKLVATNAKGSRLASVPKRVRATEAAERLLSLRDWLEAHAQECASTVESFMLRSLPVPRAAIMAVWSDAAWRSPLENAVVAALDADGEPIEGAEGFLRGVSPERGVGVVDLDGETRWIDAARVLVPHPILLRELTEYRELAVELGIEQGVQQLFRETFELPRDVDAASRSVARFANGHFKALMHALGKAKGLGYRVRGGFAVCPVWEAGGVVEARYWIGADDPMAEAYTGELAWVDEREQALALGRVGPVAWSEGMRMASAIYAARVIEETEGEG